MDTRKTTQTSWQRKAEPELWCKDGFGGNMKQSGFMAKQLAMRQALIDATERVTQQLMMDTLQIVLHNELGFGYDRIMRITKA